MKFEEKLQSLRKRKGMSQENLADEIGVSRQAVSKWELGVSLPDMDKMIALSTLFDVSIDYLVKEGVTETGSATGASPDEATNGLHTARRGWYPTYLYQYEYKSSRTLFGLPLVHINVGPGLRKAKGILAIGSIARGFISISLFSLGIISLGALSAGLISFGALTLGLLFALGGVSVGTVAIGGVAIGIVTVGGAAIGMFSLGGYASASRIAIGGYARGNIAIGKVVKGAYTLKTYTDDVTSAPADQVKALIDKVYPTLWQPLKNLILSIFSA